MRENCAARRHEKLLGRIQLKADVADLFERRIRIAGDADGRRRTPSRYARPTRFRAFAGMRDGDDRRIRSRIARLNLHQVRIGQRNRADADAHEADVEVLRDDGAGRADAEDDEIFSARLSTHRLLDFLEIKQLSACSSVSIFRLNICSSGNGRNTIGFGQIFKIVRTDLGEYFASSFTSLKPAQPTILESNNTRLRDIKLGRHLLNADRGNMYRIGYKI